MTVRRIGKLWWCDFMVDGKRYRRSLNTTNKHLAQKIEVTLRDQIIKGKWFPTEPYESKTFKDLIDRFWSEHHVSAMSLHTYESIINDFISYFGDKSLSEFNPSLIESYRQSLLSKGLAHNTIVLKLKKLKHLFNIATDKWDWFKVNPIAKVKIGVTTNRERILLPEEEELLLSKVPPWMREVILFILNTGLRKSELLNLRWKDCNLNEGLIYVYQTKNKQPLSLPLNDEAVNILREKSKVRALRNDKVFQVSIYYLNTEFRRICDSIGLEGFRIHDLRHTFASRLIEKGEDLSVVAKLMNHKSLSQTMRYVHHQTAGLKSAVMKLSKLNLCS